MSAPSFVREQAAAFLREIDRIQAADARLEPLREGRGPRSYRGPGRALGALREVVARLERTLDDLINVPTAEQAGVTARVQSRLAGLLRLLGFLVRSTSPRVAFEMCEPLERLVQSFLGQSKLLVLSSEWDMYSPFVNPFDTALDPGGLTECVFIGFPATESDNPFLLPLAAHELGHPVWHLNARLSEIAERTASSAVSATGGRGGWRIRAFAKHRTVECFCDALGTRVFGAAFLYSAAYLLANHSEDDRDFGYLLLPNRLAFLREAAKHYNVEIRDDWAPLFGDASPLLVYARHRQDPDDSKVDTAVLNAQKDIFDEADRIANEARADLPSVSDVEQIQKAFRIGTPANRPSSLAAILNAAWQERINRWPPGRTFGSEQRRREDEELRVLREIVLKTIQMLEFNHLVP